ncbi:MAG TPA: indoleacetamide hydrolase [Vicinamibacteria bacterium]|nr:indoleacetamide hydrolase [Vicinamibacteria bacterium]
MAASVCRRRELNLTELTATDAVKAMREGELRAEDYASALLQRCEAGKHLNAFITLEPEHVLGAARAADRKRDSGAVLGPLHGLPIPIKDSVNTKDFPTTAGTSALRNFRPREDAPIVRTLVEAGAIVLGKTSIHELSFGWTSNNLAFGAVRNPYDTTRIPGGSTGGTAAAVAARMAPLGVAEDTEGSIRVPAALCGICGFRPTTGRYPSQGVVPITPLFDQVGPHARTVRDCILFDTVVTGETAHLEVANLAGARLALDRRYFFEGLDPEVERLTEEALRRLRDAGAVLVEAELPDLERFVRTITAPVEYHDVVPMVTKYLEEYDTGVSFEELLAMASDDIKREFALYAIPGAEQGTSEEAYEAALEHLPALQETYRAYYRENDVAAIVFPTTLVPAPLIGQDAEVEIRGESVSFVTAISRNIGPGSTAGLPGLVLPAGLTRDGLPVGLELDGPEGNDRDLLALGLAVEAILGPLPAPTL